MFQDVAALFTAIADGVGQTLKGVSDWGPSGQRDGQYAADLLADRVVLEALMKEGLSVLSEESGLTIRRRPELVIVDPLDGSTNASQGVPWYATSLCYVDRDGPAFALVRNQATGQTYAAERGGGAWCDGVRLRPSICSRLGDAFVGLSGLPPQHLGWRQYRTLGAAALDLCLVAAGVLDAFIDCSEDAHGVWDYAAAAFICEEAGAFIGDAFGRLLIGRDPAVRRTPIAAATKPLFESVLHARKAF
jgi:fructose-1,6-bisphosphatase/inositol monophosphatase family enzyme